MGVKVKIKLDGAGLKKVIEKKQALIRANIKQAFLTNAIPHLIDLIMVGFDRLGERAELLPDDPTNPSNWREDFLLRLQDDVYDNIEILSEGNKLYIRVRMGDKKFLGYDQGIEERNSSQPLLWLVYYLEGLAGEWGFVTTEMSGKEYGRFGQGFMISREAYEKEKWQARTGISFNQIRHPFSEYSPVDIFREALAEFNLRPFIKQAIDAAVRGTEL